MTKDLELRCIKEDEIPLVKDFPPTDWNLDLSILYRFHFGEPYFHAVIALIDNKIAGTGMVILNKDVAWQGTIIVKEELRNKGIGKSITQNLIDWSNNNGANKILLCATELGKYVYEKLGFKHSMNYLIFKEGTIKNSSISDSIFKLHKTDFETILSLDKAASGEDRRKIIEKTYLTGFKFVSVDIITGYYLPDFGNGLIVAENEHSGLELLKFRCQYNKDKIAIPESNKAALNFLLCHGFAESIKVPRMYLGSETSWKPEMIYARGSGYLG